jgi:FkbM family methyltransferase
MDRSRRITANFRTPFRSFLVFGCCLFVGFYLGSIKQNKKASKDIPLTNSLVSVVNIIDPNQVLTNNLTCIKTKEIFNLYSTTICIHQGTDYVSTTVAREHIWEEDYITRLLRILIRNPHLDVIDIRANIGSYTMFTAGALGRFTLAVDCFMPNIERIARAVQIEKVQNRVVLVQNALYSKSGEHLKLSSANPSQLRLTNKTQMDSTNQYIVKTIRFDDLLPILIERGVRAAIIKIDIEGSESYLCETGSKVFDLIDIQLVMMEWGHGMRKTYEKRYQSIVDYFAQLKYVTTDVQCTVLDAANWRTTWPGNIYWIKQANFRKNIC